MSIMFKLFKHIGKILLLKILLFEQNRPGHFKLMTIYTSVAFLLPLGVYGCPNFSDFYSAVPFCLGERGGSVVECRTPEREVRGSRPTAAVLCP